MQRCLELAAKGAGNVAPNPMVGCVIVHDGKIIGEGFHEKFGGRHAEVNAINSVADQRLLQESTLYVNLEPCSHFGKTPPCADLIIEKKIPEVVIGCLDPNPLVAGNGVKKLQDEGCSLQVGVLDEASEQLNRRFFTFHKKQRPFIILKWAQSADGFIAPANGERINISNEFSRTLSHRWRSEESAIMVGTNTALRDDPQLTVRLWNGRNPIRIVLDRQLRLPQSLHLFDHSTRTVVVTSMSKQDEANVEYCTVDFTNNQLAPVLKALREKEIQSVLVEGGSQLLSSLINQNLWDEARIFHAPAVLVEGVPASKISGNKISEEDIYGDQLITLRPFS